MPKPWTVDPRSDDFLLSPAWRRLRYAALDLYGHRCACCGRTPDDGVAMNVDHIQPRQTHPELALDLANLQVLCALCNEGKGNRSTTDWRGAQVVTRRGDFVDVRAVMRLIAAYVQTPSRGPSEGR